MVISTLASLFSEGRYESAYYVLSCVMEPSPCQVISFEVCRLGGRELLAATGSDLSQLSNWQATHTTTATNC